MRFSGHESFAVRYAWLPKAFELLDRHPTALADEESAMIALGIGKNMVRSLRFWIEVFGLVQVGEKGALNLTSFARTIFAPEGGLDPYLEDKRTLWLLHWQISVRPQDPVFAWDFLINRWPRNEFTKAEVVDAFERESARHNVRHSRVTLEQHFDVFLRTYVPSRSTKDLSEDSLDSPLAELSLIEQIGERPVESGRREPLYAFRREAKDDVTPALFEYCLEELWQARYANEVTLTFRDVATGPLSPGQVFRLPEDDVRRRLDAYSGPNAASGRFSFRLSAIQDLLIRNEAQKTEEGLALLRDVYGVQPSSSLAARGLQHA